MQREIKFRAPVYDKALDKAKEPFAPYAKGFEPKFRCWVTFDLNSIGINNTDDEVIRDLDGKNEWNIAYVDLNASRQYTGRKDKDGRELYENDVLRLTSGNNSGGYYDYVIDDYDQFIYDDLEKMIIVQEGTVIGNIDENHELLEAGDAPKA